MNKTQAAIINMIRDGKRNTDIVMHTGRSPNYVSRVRRRLEENPHYFEDQTKYNKIMNRPKAKRSDFSGDVECLKCESVFRSEDRRHNRICPHCKGEVNHVMMDSSWGGGRWHPSHAE